MPTLNLITNVKIPDAKAFALELSKFGADTLHKPEAYISVIVTYNETLTFGGTFDPAFSLRIDSLDNINEKANEGYSKAFFKFFDEKLGTGAKGNRGYITFIDPGRANMGHESTTFATIFGGK
ncbi:Tautomerase/MIF superfamily [Flammula alnicola]|nr:Tautomerase/MIF superfamily [Flammula alnicola]